MSKNQVRNSISGSKLLFLLLLIVGLTDGGRMTVELSPENDQISGYGTMLPKGVLVPPSAPSPGHNNPVGTSFAPPEQPPLLPMP